MSTTGSDTHRAPAASRRPRRWRRRLVRVLAGILGVTLALALVWAAASWRYGALDARRARMTTPGPYRADLASLGAHPVPDWFADAKLGVFVHWGLFSVPGSPTAGYHRRTYGGMPYEGFQQIFEREVAGSGADGWAETFQRAGAGYLPYGDGYDEAQVRELVPLPSTATSSSTG